MKAIIKSFLYGIKNFLGILKWGLICILRHSFTYGSRKTSSSALQVSILANGPTLTDELDVIKDKADLDYCMLNDAVKTDLFWHYKPRYYVFADPLYFTQDLVTDNNVYINAFNKIDWNMTIFVPVGAYSLVKQIFLRNKKIVVEKIPSSLPQSVTDIYIRNFFFRHKLACPPVQNVVVGAIFSLIMQGYKHINLYGVGHSWLNAIAVNNKNEVCLKDVHYYDKNVELKPWYQCTGKPYKLHLVLRDLAQMFDSYHQLRCLADSYNDITIINHTKESFIDAFERI